MMPPTGFWIEKLKLSRHVEGGSFKEVYRSGLILQKAVLPAAFKNDRNISTSIYFMLEQQQFSAFHRIASDEQWHFYYGGALHIYEIAVDGHLTIHKLGNDPANDETSFQCVVKAGSWFASRPAEGAAYCIAGCTVSPGFDFEDFELAERHKLVATFPQHLALINSLTRPA
jgi:predicted cupin superfamily sugar epimerase